MHTTTTTRTAAAMLVAAALAAPTSASAATAEQFLPSSVNGQSSGAGGAGVPQTRAIELPSSGFDWGDAGLGAAGMLSLLGLGGGAVVISRRSRRSHPAIH